MSVAPLHQNNAFHNDPKFGRLLLLSLIVHGLIWVAFSGSWFGTSTRPKPPVYTVDLVHKLKGEIVECAFLVELEFLKGREKLKEPVYSLMKF